MMGLAPVLPEKSFGDLEDLFNQLLKDSEPKVRLNVISRLDEAVQVFTCMYYVFICTFFQILGMEKLTEALLPAVVDLALDKSWRVRLEIIGHMPLLAEQLV